MNALRRSPCLVAVLVVFAAGCGSRSALSLSERAPVDAGFDSARRPDVVRVDERPDEGPDEGPDVELPDVPVPPEAAFTCDLNFPVENVVEPSPSCVVLGRVATWCGKVSVYTRPDGSWVVEEGCQLGCDTEMEVCQRHFPGALRVEQVTRSRVCKPFMTQGCLVLYPHVGINEFVCCGARP